MADPKRERIDILKSNTAVGMAVIGAILDINGEWVFSPAISTNILSLNELRQILKFLEFMNSNRRLFV